MNSEYDTTTAPTVRATWPHFAEELAAALTADGYPHLARQVDELPIVLACSCADDFCQSFHTAPPPDGPYGPGHVNVCLDGTQPGYLILDVADDRIVYVEVLYRPPLS